MNELERLTHDAAAKAALTVGKDAAKQAVERLLDGEASPADKKDASKSRRWKVIALAVLGLCLFLGLVGMVLNYWVWFFGAGVVGLAGLYGYYRLRKRLGRPKEGLAEGEPPSQARQALRVAAPVEEPKPAEPTPEARRAEAKARARAMEEARAQQEQQVEDELAALKARMKK